MFESIRETSRGTVMIISHQERILSIADEIVVIDGGKVVRQGPRDEVLPEILGTSSAQNAACSRLEQEG